MKQLTSMCYPPEGMGVIVLSIDVLLWPYCVQDRCISPPLLPFEGWSSVKMRDSACLMVFLHCCQHGDNTILSKAFHSHHGMPS
jgi:hypothetical protein